MTKELDFGSMENCVCFNLRRFSRVFAQFFVSELHQHGLLPTQTPILAALSARSEANMADLSEWLAMDRTTLVRNFRPLERDGLVKSTGKGRGHKVSLELTPKGRAALKQFLPDWHVAQQKVVQTLGKERWSEILRDLQRAALALN
jgi:DNA-binding MarR family transcriptional regulator